MGSTLQAIHEIRWARVASFLLPVVLVCTTFDSYAAGSKMPLRKGAKQIKFSKGSVVFFSIDIENKVNQDVDAVVVNLWLQPEAGKTKWFETNVPGVGQGQGSFLQTLVKKTEALAPTRQILSAQLKPGKYTLRQIDGVGKFIAGKAEGQSQGFWKLLPQTEFVVGENEIIYLGHLKGELVLRASDDDSQSAALRPGAGWEKRYEKLNTEAGFFQSKIVWSWEDHLETDVASVKEVCEWFDESAVEKRVATPTANAD